MNSPRRVIPNVCPPPRWESTNRAGAGRSAPARWRHDGSPPAVSADPQYLGDLPVHFALRHPIQHLAFPAREPQRTEAPPVFPFIAHVRAEVADVRLLRMDESLGFHASMFFGSFDYVGSWLWDVQYVFYAGIGVLVMGVAGGLFLADDRGALQRLLRSVILAGFLGWIGYWILPAVGPTTAFPELFSGTTQERAAARSAALARTEPMIQPPQFPRDCAPSLHTAWALIALLAAWRRPSFSWALPFGLLSIITTLTLCKHYTADLIMAVPFALFCWWLAGDNRLNRAWRPFLVAVTGAVVAVAVWAVWAPLPFWLGWILALVCLVWPVHAWVQRTGVSRASRGAASCSS